ncbi:hypothetical protein L1987_32656 [Smallanthus sonchifolius]|uniref:Uncharacterized protein n=1 Tax=Smallanthus sonchifolius TaxID=185202 RepID=A0ACB9HNM1_9ASTR|nr:hypothetical protein L1987_32656 [Smallanthus sonchifolius]
MFLQKRKNVVRVLVLKVHGDGKIAEGGRVLFKMVSTRGRGRGRGRGRPPVNRRQIEEHSHVEIHENEEHVSNVGPDHEEHVSHAESIHEERLTLEPEVRATIVEEVGIVLQATLPADLATTLKESNKDNPRGNPHGGRRRN